MTNRTWVFSQLSKLLFDLEIVGENAFKSKLLPSSCKMWQGVDRSIFGGQVAAQSLTAAYHTVPDDRLCHSFHSYFLSNGDKSKTVDFQVAKLRDGGSYSHRMVQATQSGKSIFAMLASFSKEEPDSIIISHPMPVVKQPEALNVTALLSSVIESDKTDAKLRTAAKDQLDRYNTMSMDIEPVDPMVYFGLRSVEQPITHLWHRLRGLTNSKLTPRQCQILTAYMSDMGILRGSFVTGVGRRPVFVTSLDHSVYFHKQLNPLEYSLLESQAVFGGQGRTTNRGHIWSRDGCVVASIFQEAVVRFLDAKI